MKIETKYNIGDEVWFNTHDCTMCSKIKSIFFPLINGNHVVCYLMEEMWTDQFIVLEEGTVFPTKEELLKSLQ